MIIVAIVPCSNNDRLLRVNNILLLEPCVLEVILEGVTEYLTCENLTETANDLSKVLSNIQSTWLSRKLKASVQSKVTDFFK